MPEQDYNLNDYRYIYFNNALNWNGDIKATVNSKQYTMTFSDDMQLYYCRIPTADVQKTVTFTVGSTTVNAGTVNSGKVYEPTSASNGSWKLPNAIGYEQTVGQNSKSVDVVIKYNEADSADSKSSNDYSQTEKSFTTNVNITNGNISQAIADATSQMGLTSVYDDFTFYGSNIDYVRQIASLTDDRLQNSLPYSAYVNPECFAHPSDTFSAVYNNSEKYIAKLNKAYDSWIKYYKKIHNQFVEIDFEDIDSSMSNLDKIELYAFSKPKSYTVTLHYPTSESQNVVAFTTAHQYLEYGQNKINSLFVNKDNTVQLSCRYNELLSNPTDGILESPDGKTFDGWYILNFNGDTVASYLKVSSEKDYKYRVTGTVDLYAVYRDTGTPDATATALASSVDKFQVDVDEESQLTDNGIRYRYNTVLNINDYKTTDGAVTDVAVIYAYGSSPNALTAKSNITNNFINSKETGTTAAISGTNYKIYKYTNGSNGTVELTNKNRLQFVLTLRENQVTNQGAYSNVLAFVAYKCSDGTWKVSDNCVSYVNGKLQSQW